MGTFSGARQYVLETFAKTESAAMKKRVARYLVSTECPDVRRQAAPARGRSRSRSPGSTSPTCRASRSSGWPRSSRPYAAETRAGLEEARAEHPEKAIVACRIARGPDGTGSRC